MKIKTTLIALTLGLAPTFALAGGGCNWEKTQQSASSCAEGTVYDATSGTCVPQTTS
ncbi:MAG: adenylosuccinate lyase [Paracoccaceae bacterium]